MPWTEPYTHEKELNIYVKDTCIHLKQPDHCGRACSPCSALRREAISPSHCNTLQHTATHYNTLQHTATHKLLWSDKGSDLCLRSSLVRWREWDRERQRETERDRWRRTFFSASSPQSSTLCIALSLSLHHSPVAIAAHFYLSLFLSFSLFLSLAFSPFLSLSFVFLSLSLSLSLFLFPPLPLSFFFFPSLSSFFLSLFPPLYHSLSLFFSLSLSPSRGEK